MGREGKGGAKMLPYQFFPCNIYKRRNYTQIFLNFSFNPFATLVQKFEAKLSASPRLLNLNQEQPSKQMVCLVKSF